MIPAAFPRSVAIALLRFAIWIAPHDTLDWGHGMLSELNHVEGNWSALIWSLGGAGVLAKHAIVAVILPGTHRRTVSSASELFSKEIPMRKTTLAVIVSCVIASLLFFLAPVFRQAFQVSLAQWHDVFDTKQSFGYPSSDQELDALAKKAEQNQDAEALAFVAVRYPNAIQRAHFADEAVHLDPNLTWLYAVAGTAYLSPSEIDRRVSLLKQWDPQNALPHLFAAQKIGATVTYSKEFPQGKLEPSPAWEKEMDAAFQSPKLDSYVVRLKQLNQRVISRYHLNDPFQAASDENWYGFPNYGVWYCVLYAQSLLESGQALESRGDRKAAFEKYLVVARFGQFMSIDGEFTFFMRREMKEAYGRLAALSQTEGNGEAASFYTSLADQFDKSEEKERTFMRNRAGGTDVSLWNAFLVRLSGLAILLCAALVFLCALGVVIRNRSLRLASLHPSRLTLALCSGAAIGSLLSSAILFVSYWPYSEIFRRFLSKGDDAGLSELSIFLRDVQRPLGSRYSLGTWIVSSSMAVFYFWLAITIVCALALLIAVFRHFQTRPRASVPA
ncbi:MAG TPA: hypothetical protein VJW94_16385 [Candidatus Acidoferrum sp.]|nr:hypothetical protein [Candidatus Acidoferrum sp.]